MSNLEKKVGDVYYIPYLPSPGCIRPRNLTFIAEWRPPRLHRRHASRGWDFQLRNLLGRGSPMPAWSRRCCYWEDERVPCSSRRIAEEIWQEILSRAGVEGGGDCWAGDVSAESGWIWTARRSAVCRRERVVETLSWSQGGMGSVERGKMSTGLSFRGEG